MALVQSLAHLGLLVDLDVQVFLLLCSCIQILDRESNLLLRPLIERLQLIKKLPLVRNIGLLIIKLSAKLAEVILLLCPLDLYRRLQVSFLFLLVFDRRLLALHLQSERVCLRVKLLLLLLQNEQRVKKALHRLLATAPQRADDLLCGSDSLPENARLFSHPFHILNQVVEISFVGLCFFVIF